MNLRTKLRAIAVAGFAAFASISMVTPSQAITVNIDPGDSNVLAFNTVFLTGDESFASNAPVFDVFNFTLPDLLGGNGTESVAVGFDVTFAIPTLSDVGIADLTFTLFDVTNNNTLSTTALTDSSGLAFAPGGINFTSIFPAPIALTLTVTGTALGNGGSYSAVIAAVPVPPAALLFGTALVGIGFLSRRRRKKSAAALQAA